MVRDDDCIRLTTVHLRTSIENGWCSGTLTSTYGVTQQIHRYSRLGNAETGYMSLDYDTIYHGHQCYGIPFETVSSGIASRLLWRCPPRHVAASRPCSTGHTAGPISCAGTAGGLPTPPSARAA